MFKSCATVLILLFMVFLISCAKHTYTVGNGPAFNRTNVEREWYLPYGLVAINDINTKAMAEGRSNYEIHSRGLHLSVAVFSDDCQLPNGFGDALTLAIPAR